MTPQHAVPCQEAVATVPRTASTLPPRPEERR
jgi:hypothetical protein